MLDPIWTTNKHNALPFVNSVKLKSLISKANRVTIKTLFSAGLLKGIVVGIRRSVF